MSDYVVTAGADAGGVTLEAVESRADFLAPRTIGEFLRAYREDADLSQVALARLMRERDHKWSQSTVRSLERDDRTLGFTEAVHLSWVLAFDLDDLTEVIPGAEPDVCPTCFDDPFQGFRCRTCGRSA